MAFLDDPEFIIAHIRHSCVITDDTGKPHRVLWLFIYEFLYILSLSVQCITFLRGHALSTLLPQEAFANVPGVNHFIILICALNIRLYKTKIICLNIFMISLTHMFHIVFTGSAISCYHFYVQFF